MKLRSRLDKVEAAIAATEPREPFRIVRIILTPEHEVIAAWHNGITIDRVPGEAEEAFSARVDKEIRESSPSDCRPLVPVTDNDANL